VTRVAIVDLLCNSPYYCAPLTAALRAASIDAELVSPRFYPEPGYLDSYPRAPWVVDLVVHASRPRVVRLVVRAAEVAFNLTRLVARIADRRYDVVHVQWIPLETRSSLFMRFLRHRCDAAGVRLVYTAHNAVPHDRQYPRAGSLRQNLDAAHVVIAQTEHVAAQLNRDVGTKAPVIVIGHGPLFIDCDLPRHADAVARLGLTTGQIVLFLGLIRPYKGIDLLADAWPIVRESIPGAVLLVVGKVDHQLDDDVARLRTMPGVRVVDRYLSVQEMLDYHAACDIVVFPYRRISQSGALMTAVGLGRPVVVTPIDGLLEQVRGLMSATVADAVSAPAIADAIARALHDVDTKRTLALADRESVESSETGWPSIARATALAYEQTLALAASSRPSP
jgi:glycosyltransferase involved in cell wall biosynthesis